MPKMSQLDLDDYVVRVWKHKKDDCVKRGIEWKMSLTGLRNILRAEHCYFTGVKLTKPTGDSHRMSDLTIDRIDASKGYEKGNVVACCKWANGLKNVVEGASNNDVSFEAAKKVIDKTLKRIKMEGKK